MEERVTAAQAVANSNNRIENVDNLSVDPNEAVEDKLVEVNDDLVYDEFCSNDVYFSKLVTSDRKKCSV